jgi:hypothetical protein
MSSTHSTIESGWMSMKQAPVCTCPSSFSMLIEHANGIGFFLAKIFLIVDTRPDIITYA